MKKFKSAMFGYRKKDVRRYLDHMLKEHADTISAKDEEIAQLSRKLCETNALYQGIKRKEDSINEEREKISQAFLRASRAGEEMIEEARIQAKKEVEDLETYAEKEREKIVCLKRELKYLKESAKTILARYDEAMAQVTREETREGH